MSDEVGLISYFVVENPKKQLVVRGIHVCGL